MFSYSLYADFFSRSQIAKSICVVHAGGWCPTWRPVLPSTTSGRPFCDIIGYLRPLDRPFSDIIDFHRPLGRTSSDIIGFQKPLGRPFSDIIGFQRPLGRPFSDIIGFQKLLGCCITYYYKQRYGTVSYCSSRFGLSKNDLFMAVWWHHVLS